MSVTPLYQNSLEHLLAELRRITATLSERVQQLSAANPNEVDEFQGLYVSEEEVNELLADPTLFRAGNYDYQGHEVGDFLNGGQIDSRLGRLQRVFGLSPFELDVLLIALAPELDLRYEKLYIYLQDDVTRRRPSVDLTLRLLCPGLAGQVAARRCFDADAPLLKYRVIELSEENQAKQVSLLARSIKLDEGIVAYLLGETRLDARLRQLASFTAEDSAFPMLSKMGGLVERLVELTVSAEPGDFGFVQALIGPDESGKLNLAGEICRRLGIPLVVAEASVVPGLAKAEQLLRLLEREARLRGAAIYWAGFDTLLKEEQASAQEAYRTVIRYLKEQSGLCFVSSSQPLPPLMGGLARREFQSYVELPTYTERQQLWEVQLGPEAVGLDLESLSSRFKLSSGQIAAAANTARHAAIWRGETTPSLEDLEAACRRHSNQRLNSLARKITPQYSWDDLVLPTDQYNMLYEIYHQVKNRSLVYEKWGFDSRVALGKGLNVIFAGPSGTGKTMSAGIIAHELGMDIYKIDLSNVVSKYIGETEKNLERIFNEAGESNAILFFDEADSIFGKRSEVKDAHDRYANIETGYLLQKMEEYDGIVVLATNLRKNLDEAFIRRMHFIIEFPFPEEDDRFEIWQKVFPAEVPMDDKVDLRFMARQFKVAGGNIKNIALAAAFMAASEHHQIEMNHLIFATRREFQKMGKLCTESDFGAYYSLFKDFEPKARNLNRFIKQ